MAALVLRVVAIAALLAGCGGVQLRPDGSPGAEPCPAGADQVLARFGLRERSRATVQLDARYSGPGPLIIYDGPLESETWLPVERLPGGVHLFGRAWTSGPRVIIRYYSVQVGSERLPICAVVVADDPAEGQGLRKTQVQPGAAAVKHADAVVFMVGEFR